MATWITLVGGWAHDEHDRRYLAGFVYCKVRSALHYKDLDAVGHTFDHLDVRRRRALSLAAPFSTRFVSQTDFGKLRP